MNLKVVAGAIAAPASASSHGSHGAPRGHSLDFQVVRSRAAKLR